jgi:cytochrome c553
VSTDGPDGRLEDYPVAYVFGVTPLQQYLLELPGGRLQALSIAWDSRPSDGGRPALVPPLPRRGGGPRRRAALDEARPELEHAVRRVPLDEPAQGLPPRGGPLRDHVLRDRRLLRGLPRPGIAPRGVGGAGASEGSAAEGASRASSSASPSAAAASGRWTWSAGSRDPRRSSETRFEVETCARCHARRGLLTEEHRPGRLLAETHRPALLDEGLYYADGQMRDEVYSWGSFLQSRMYAKGVTCSDCHDAHDLKVRGGERRSLLLVPPARALRDASAPLPPGERAGRLVRGLPHADGDLHGRGPEARPLVPRAASRPHGLARAGARPERLQRLPPRPLAAVGRPGGAPVVPRRAAGEAPLRHRPPRGAVLPARRRGPAPGGDPRPEAARDRAGHGGLAPSSAPRSRLAPALEEAARDAGPPRPPRGGHGPRGAPAEGARAGSASTSCGTR